MKLISYPLQQPLPFALLVSAGALAVALFSQYGFGTYPCELCIYQRIPYALIALLCLMGLFHARKHKTDTPKHCPYRFGLLALVTLLFVFEAGLGWYHVSVEAGLLGSSCATDTRGGETLEDLRALIESAPIVSCSDVGANFLGVSMALWNALAASAVSAIFIVILKKNGKRTT